jgi:hypothetical protein
MNTTESAAAVSGDPATAEIMIQAKTRRRHRPRTEIALRQIGAERWLNRKIAGQFPQVVPGSRGVRGRRALFKLLQRQPPVRVGVPQDVYDAVPLFIGGEDRSVGHRRGPFPVVPLILTQGRPEPSARQGPKLYPYAGLVAGGLRRFLPAAGAKAARRARLRPSAQPANSTHTAVRQMTITPTAQNGTTSEMVTKVEAFGSRSVAHLSVTLLADLSFGHTCVRCDLGKVLVCEPKHFTPVT